MFDELGVYIGIYLVYNGKVTVVHISPHSCHNHCANTAREFHKGAAMRSLNHHSQYPYYAYRGNAARGLEQFNVAFGRWLCILDVETKELREMNARQRTMLDRYC